MSKKQVCAALLAHVDAGKTTLSEALLYTSGKIRSCGRVDKGDAYLDTFELEKQRGITIFSKQAQLKYNDTDIVLLDTPGHVDFSAEMERTLQVLDYAVLIISGADGVQGHTETLWRLLEKYEVPTYFFVNKMDQKGIEAEAVLHELQNSLSPCIVDFTNLKQAETKEQLALCDEELLEVYLETGDLPYDKLGTWICKRKIYPCFFGAALRLEGVEEFLQAFTTYAKMPVYTEEFAAKVFKIARDEQENRLTYLKMTGGILVPRMELLVGDEREKVNQIRVYSGGRYDTVQRAEAGMVCAVTGLTKTYPGQGLGSEPESEKPVLEPVLTYRIDLPKGCEVAAFLPKLKELEEEQPELHIVWNESLQEIQAHVMGEVQIEILKNLIASRFAVDVSFGQGNIVYRETITEAIEGVGHYEPLRHYAEVHVWIEPGEPGSGVRIATDCSEDMLDRNWQRLVLTHLEEREHKGVLTGSSLTDVKITLIGGKAHLKHTEGGDFRQATYRAVRQGLRQTQSVLLEPYYEYRLEVPEENVGRAISDIERMSGTFSLMQGLKEELAVLTGEAPVSTMRDYTREVVVYTKGQGHLSCSLLGYRPCHNADEVITAMRYDADKDVDNPSGSVFCAKGAGFFVPWNEVRNHMHVDMKGYGKRSLTEEDMPEETQIKEERREEGWLDVEEIDAILEKTSHANRRRTPVSHKGISAKRIRSVRSEKPIGLSKPRKKTESDKRYLLVDGYNIIFAWEELNQLAKENMGAAREALADILCNYQGYRNCEVILVFDAYRVQNHKTEQYEYHNIHVIYTREAETADRYIEKFAHENSKKYAITVATSDGMEQIIIRGAGCRLLSARDLKQEVERVKEELRQWTE